MTGDLKKFYVYILANQRNGTLYIGVTNSLKRRIQEHKNKTIQGFTAKYNVNKLVYFEIYTNPGQAIYREKYLKNYRRGDKLFLIEKDNPTWRDLYNELF